MDKYKHVFEKGRENYLQQLESIGWFDNEYINRSEIEKAIKECYCLSNLVNQLTQMYADVDRVNKDMFIDLMDSICDIIPYTTNTVKANGNKITIDFIISKIVYSITINVEDFEFGEGDDDHSFMNSFINESLAAEGYPHQFYELPPCDEVGNYIFVLPQVYDKALEMGLIPNDIGYHI